MYAKYKLKTWWLLLLTGCLLFTIGVFAFVKPFHTFINLVTYSGGVLLLNGIFLVIVSNSNTGNEQEKNWLIAESVLDFAFGIMLVFNPLLTFIVFPLLIGPWMFCIGILKITASIALRKIINGWVFIFAAGLISVCFGFLVVNDPIEKASGITTLIGAFGIVMGALNVFDAFRFKKTTAELNMMF